MNKLPSTAEIYEWLKLQNFQTEHGEQEYMMYFDVDMPDILNRYVKWINEPLVEFVKPRAMKFINKVRSGNARSVETYQDMLDIVKYIEEIYENNEIK